MIQSNEKVLKIVGAYFVPSVGVNVLTESDESVTIQFHPGYDWEEIKFASAFYDEPPKDTDNGLLYNQELKLTIAGDEEELQGRISELISAKPIIKFEYDNGVSKVVGDKENYCQLLSKFSSEGFITKRDITLGRQSPQPALFLNS
jgi:hypothetical protein